MRVFKIAIASMLMAASSDGIVRAATIIDDFSGGVTAVNSPLGAGVFGTWYDTTHQTFGTPSASTLSGSAAMLISDGGFENGVYAIYQAVVPSDGMFTVSTDMLFNDTATSQVTNYQLGVIVNGDHRPDGTPSYLAGTSIFGDYTGLTSNSLDVTAIQNVVTSAFSAQAGDNLTIVLADNVTTGAYTSAAAWNGATVLVDNIMLNTVIPEPSTFALAGLALVGVAFTARRRVR